ncbi:hypothetical protein PALA111701_19080 [Paenibacillus lactis]
MGFGHNGPEEHAKWVSSGEQLLDFYGALKAQHVPKRDLCE